jgi:hypothetical protein
MYPRITGRVCAVALTSILLLAATAAFGAPPIGPTYPLPGGPGTGHGGSTCFAASNAEAAMGKTAAQNSTSAAGQTLFYGGGSTPAQTGPGCPFDATPGASVTPFDTTRFARLFWGMSTAPELALDGTVDNAGGTIETLVLNTTPGPNTSDLPNGKLVWTGTTSMQWCVPVSCASFTTSTVAVRFELRATTLADVPVALVDPSTVEVDPATGGLVEVTPALTNFKVNLVMLAQNPTTGLYEPAISMYNSLNHPIGTPPSTQMGFGGAFRYTDRPPTGSIGHSTLKENQPVTFTATASDPDGTIASYAWALGGDAVFDDGTGPTAQGTFGAGPHTVQVRVTDDEGSIATLTDTFTITDTTAPVASLTVAAAKLKAVLKSGLKTTTNTNEGGTIALSVAIKSKLAKKLGLKNPVAQASLPATAGANAATVKLAKKTAKKLKSQKKVVFTVTCTVTDAAGNTTTLTQSITAKR